MNPPKDTWAPSPEILAAYYDGELANSVELEALCRRVEEWLIRHPEGHADLADLRRLDRLWQETAPPEPDACAWQKVEARLVQPVATPVRRLPWARWPAAIIASAAAIALAAWLGTNRQSLSPTAPRHPALSTSEEIEAFPVATAAEITILQVEGGDTQTLVVGKLPLHGPIELAGPGEVVLTSVQPDGRDNMLPHVRMTGPQRPMIWAPVDAEER